MISHSAVTAGMRGAVTGVSPPRQSPPCIYTHVYRYVDHVSGVEKSDLDHVLTRKRPIYRSRLGPLFGLVVAPSVSPFSSLPTLPGVASAVLACLTTRGAVVDFYTKCLNFRRNTYQSDTYTSTRTNVLD